MRLSTVTAALLLLAVVLAPMMAPDADAASADVVNERVMITNIYSSEFVSPGTLDEGEHENSGIFFFIEGSERHELFKKYLRGSIRFVPGDDWQAIDEGSRIHAYFFDSNIYREWHTLVTFTDPLGDLRFLSLSFRIEIPIDSLNFFFLKGSVAHITWRNTESVPVSAYFDGTELKANESEIRVERNGAYSLNFVTVSNTTDVISTVVSYHVDGFEKSSSMSLGSAFWTLSLIALAAMAVLRRGPAWSGRGGLN